MPLAAEFVPLDHFFALHTGVVGGRRLHVVPLGDLVIPSGRLEACDPFAMLGGGAVVPIPPGRHPVHVTVADVSEEQDGRHLREAYLSLVLAEGEAVAVRDLDPDEPDGGWGLVGVDAGTVAFVDHEALDAGMPAPARWYDEVYDSGRPDSWFALMDDPAHLVAGAANIPLPLAEHGENVVLSHSGWGDGGYPLVATVDADDRILAIHIDLLVVTEKPETAGESSA